MNDNSENFIRLISSYFNNNTAELRNPDGESIFNFADIHDLGGIVYAKVKDSGVCDEKILKMLRDRFAASVRYSVLQEAVLNELVGILNKNKIKHILFKGVVLKRYYHDKELRSMGDIDIVIEKGHQRDVHDMLVENGFQFDELSSHKEVRNYIKNGICFEIHTQIIVKNIFDDVDYVGYFSDSFKKAVLTEGYTYEFSNEHHLIYLMAHMAKHFKSSGCGVRMVLDIAFFVKGLNKEISRAEVEKGLSSLKLDRFSACIFELCEKWFGVDIPIFKTNVSDDEINAVGEYIVDGGVFGYNGKNIDAIRINKGSGSFADRFKNMMKIIFPSYENIKLRYVMFENMPKYMLPIGWVRLWWYRIVENRENSLKRIKQAFENNDDAEEHNRLMNIVGLKDGRG